jgi:hypothetical protein
MSGGGHRVGVVARVPTLVIEYGAHWHLLCTGCGHDEIYDSEQELERARCCWDLVHACVEDPPSLASSRP